MSRTHRAPPSNTQHIAQPFTPVPPAIAHSARAGLALTSRSRPATVHGVSRPQARYDPRAVLAARTQAIKSQSPPRFQRRIVRPRARSPDGRADTSAAAREVVDPVTRAQHEHKEAAWKAPSTYSSMANEVRHKSQQALFSTAPPLVSAPTAHAHALSQSAADRTGRSLDSVSCMRSLCRQFYSAPAETLSQHTVAGLPPSLEAREPRFRAVSATPLQAHLESKWNGTDLYGSAHNMVITRAHRRYFDSPTRSTGAGGTALSQEQIESLLMAQEGAAERAALARLTAAEHSGRPKSRANKQARRSAQSQWMLQQSLQPLPLSALDGHMQQLAPVPASYRRGGLSPERLLTERALPLSSSLSSSLGLDPAASSLLSPLSSSALGPALLAPSFFHPENRFFRSIPKGNPREVVWDRKRERGWNGRHQIEPEVEGW